MSLFDRRVLRSIAKFPLTRTLHADDCGQFSTTALNSNQILIAVADGDGPDSKIGYSDYEVIDIRKGSVVRERIKHNQHV